MSTRTNSGRGEITIETQDDRSLSEDADAVRLRVRFVLGRPMTFAPCFHWPRFFKSSTRSKRFKTLRLAVMVLAPLRLRCCDINSSRSFLGETGPGKYVTDPIYQMETEACHS